MDVRFLKIVSESFIVDCEKTLPTEEVFNELYDMVKYIRFVDPELYEELYSVDKVKQQQILRLYLEQIYTEDVEDLLSENDDEYLLEDGGVSAIILTPAAILSFIVAGLIWAGRKTISKAFFKTISVIGKGLTQLGKFLIKRGSYASLRYAIIQENFRGCYINCGLTDPSKISSMAYLSIKEGKGSFQIASKQAKCLRDCFIDNLIEVINLQMECYFACLKRTGSIIDVKSSDPDSLIKMIESTKVSAVCQTYYDEARKALELFYNTLELVYDDNLHRYDDIKLGIINKLRSRIYGTRDMIIRADERTLSRYGGEGQRQNPNYQGNKPNPNYQGQRQNPNYQGNKPNR